MTALRRRTLFLGFPSALAGGARAATLSAGANAVESGSDRPDPNWAAFRSTYILPDGRVVDTGNGGVSHTEGQGWGLLFAEHFDDQPTFDRILAWTSRTLRRPRDALHAWRYLPGAANPVPDGNNATDGDLCIAWALARAARRWGAADHALAAANIAHDVLRLLTVRLGNELLLLPGVEGFQLPAAVVVNPSYYVFPALDALEKLAPSAEWAALRRHGSWLIDRGRFAAWQLPPDWLQVGRSDGALAPAPPWPPRCSFDAIRVPLYLAWAGLPSPAIAAFATFYAPRNGRPPPAWVDLRTEAEAPYPAPPGMLAVGRLAAAASGSAATPLTDLPSVADAPDYYSAALILLTRIVSQERRAA